MTNKPIETARSKKTAATVQGKPLDSTRNNEPMLSDQEKVLLLHALSRGAKMRGLRGFTEAEAEAVWNWAHKTRVAHHILELALLGLVAVAIREDGELTFTAMGPNVPADKLQNYDPVTASDDRST